MKLKERVTILSLVACLLLMFIQYHRRTTNKLDTLTATELDQDSYWSDLANEHYHKVREDAGINKETLELKDVTRTSQPDLMQVQHLITTRGEHNKPLKYLREIRKNRPNVQLIRTEKRSVNLLNKIHRIEPSNKDESFLNKTKQKSDSPVMDAWDYWYNMVDSRHVTRPDDSLELASILKAMAERKIVRAGVGIKGTQLKATFLLSGSNEQRVVFKPKRYDRNHVINGKPYDGYDRHNGEIAAFHLDRILGFNRAPPVVGRKVNLVTEVKPVAGKELLKTFFHNDKADTCFYGVCYYCKADEPACGHGEIMEGSITVWLPFVWELQKYRHPWQRTYTSRKAKWEIDDNYCKSVIINRPYNRGPRLLDIMDTAIFDFLIGNADRHHYEAFKKDGDSGMLLHLDNAKSFGDPQRDEMTILAPVFQCCKLRKSTFKRLQEFKQNGRSKYSLSSKLRHSLMADPLYPVLSEPHLQAMDRRLKKSLEVVKKCIEINGAKNVLIDDGL